MVLNMDDIINELFKSIFQKLTLEIVGFMFIGSVATLWYLQNNLRVFERLDDLNDTMKEVIELLKHFEKIKITREIKRRIEKGELTDDDY